MCFVSEYGFYPFNLDEKTTESLAAKLRTEHRPGCIWLSDTLLCPGMLRDDYWILLQLVTMMYFMLRQSHIIHKA